MMRNFHDLPDLPLLAFLPGPDKRLKLYKGGGGGGGGQVKYDNLEDLYAAQTANAQLLLGQAQQHLPGATQQYMAKANEVQGQNYVDGQVTNAMADMAKANGMERAAVNRNLASMGVNASDPRYASALRATEINNAARMAAGANSTRDKAKQYQLAVSQDALGTMTGTNNSAAAQLGSATNGLSSLYSTQQQLQNSQDAQRSQNIANGVGGAFSLLMSKDGGKVPGLAMLAGGGLTGGGLTGGTMNSPITPPMAGSAQAPENPDQVNAMKMAKAGKDFLSQKGANFMDKMSQKGANAMNNMGKAAEFFGAPQAGEMQAYASGMTLDAGQAGAAQDAYLAAAREAKAAGDMAGASQYATMGNSIGEGAGLSALNVGSQSVPGAAQGMNALGSGLSGIEIGAAGAEVAGGIGAEAAGTLAAEAAAGAVGEGVATSALTSGLGAVATALPWVAGAYGIGSLLGLFNEGGKVADLRETGGQVPGTWQENKDTVPALLVPEEGVLNAEATAMIGGKPALDKLNAKGLKLRKKGVTPPEIEGNPKAVPGLQMLAGGGFLDVLGGVGAGVMKGQQMVAQNNLNKARLEEFEMAKQDRARRQEREDQVRAAQQRASQQIAEADALANFDTSHLSPEEKTAAASAYRQAGYSPSALRQKAANEIGGLDMLQGIQLGNALSAQDKARRVEAAMQHFAAGDNQGALSAAGGDWVNAAGLASLQPKVDPDLVPDYLGAVLSGNPAGYGKSLRDLENIRADNKRADANLALSQAASGRAAYSHAQAIAEANAKKASEAALLGLKQQYLSADEASRPALREQMRVMYGFDPAMKEGKVTTALDVTGRSAIITDGNNVVQVPLSDDAKSPVPLYGGRQPAQASTADKYISGKTYTDGAGNKAKYLGGGKWQPL